MSRGAGVYCPTCLPPPSQVGIAEYRRRHRALQEVNPNREYNRSYHRALRALAERHKYEFALLLADMRAQERGGSDGRDTERAEPAG